MNSSSLCCVLLRPSEKAPRLEVQRPANPHLAVGSGRFQRSLGPFAHRAQSDLGVRFEPALLLEERSRFPLRASKGHPRVSCAFALGNPPSLSRAGEGAASSSESPGEMERAANRLPANQGDPLLEQLHGQKLAAPAPAPARAQPAMLGG